MLAATLSLGVGSSAAGMPQIVSATLLSNAIQLDMHDVKAGEVTLNVHNAGGDANAHELVVLRTDRPDGSLPVVKGQVPERKFMKIGEVEDVAPGKSKRFTIKLAPGHYVLICNKAGHYAAGMHTSLTVAP
ncbi:hypothetical protein [Trinickia terrae]|nr:hypothetical protein [Trinickia terrae]